MNLHVTTKTHASAFIKLLGCSNERHERRPQAIVRGVWTGASALHAEGVQSRRESESSRRRRQLRRARARRRFLVLVTLLLSNPARLNSHIQVSAGAWSPYDVKNLPFRYTLQVLNIFISLHYNKKREQRMYTRTCKTSCIQNLSTRAPMRKRHGQLRRL